MYRGNFGGGNMQMQNIMRQAQKMQEELQKNLENVEKELEEAELTAKSGGGMVTVVVSGKKKVKSITISPAAVDPDDVEMLEDMILACVNEAMDMAEELEQEKKGAVTGGMGPLGGMF